jgi:ribose-phosphate pyrophosphokinase
VFVLQSLYGDEQQSVNDKLCRLLFFLGALRDASAGRITAVIPYLCYAREDQKTAPRDSVTTRYVARMFEAAGVDHVVALDVHNRAAFENAFRIPTDHLQAAPLFVEHFVSLFPSRELVVVSPDAGGIKRAESFRELLREALGRPVSSAFLTKRRGDGVEKDHAIVVGDLKGRVAIIYDDMISTGATLHRAASACREGGVTAVYAAATHGLFVGEASSVIADAALDHLIVTDSIPPFRLEQRPAAAKLTTLAIAPLLAEAIRRIHKSGSTAQPAIELTMA